MSCEGCSLPISLSFCSQPANTDWNAENIKFLSQLFFHCALVTTKANCNSKGLTGLANLFRQQSNLRSHVTQPIVSWTFAGACECRWGWGRWTSIIAHLETHFIDQKSEISRAAVWPKWECKVTLYLGLITPLVKFETSLGALIYPKWLFSFRLPALTLPSGVQCGAGVICRFTWGHNQSSFILH